MLLSRLVPSVRDLPVLVFAFEDACGRLGRDAAAMHDSRIGVIAPRGRRAGIRTDSSARSSRTEPAA